MWDETGNPFDQWKSRRIIQFCHKRFTHTTNKEKINLSNTHKTQVPKIQFKDPYSETSEN